MNSYMINVAKLPQRTVLWVGTGCLAVFVVLLPIMGWLSDKIGRRPLLLFSCIAYIVLGYPFFLMAASGSLGLAILAQLLMVVLYAPYAGTCPSFYTEIFPTRVRYTALSVGYNIAVAIFGGFAPFIATFLVHDTGSNSGGWRITVRRPRFHTLSGGRISATACSGVAASITTMSAGLPGASP